MGSKKIYALSFLLFFVLCAFNGIYSQDRFNLGKTTTPRFDVNDRLWPQKVGEASVSLWADDKLSAFTLTIDDNNEQDIPFWKQMQAKYNLNFTWFIITEADEKYNVKCWKCFQDLAENGNAIQGHDDRNWYEQPKKGEKNLSKRKYRKRLMATKQKIETLIKDQRCSTYAYPWGEGNDVVTNDLFIATRDVVGLPNQANLIDYNHVNSISNPHIYENNASMDTYFQPILTRTHTLEGGNYYRGWLSTHFHHVDSEEAHAKADGFLNYIKQQEDKLWVATFPDVAKYSQEYATHNLTVDEVSDDHISFTLSDDMRDEIFDFPLTVKVRLAENWSSLSALQNGIVLDHKVVYHEGNTYALIKAIPDKGQVVLKRTAEKAKKIETSTIDETLVFQLDFKNDSVGKYTSADLTKDIGAVKWMMIDDRASIVRDSSRGNVLKVSYPTGAVGPKQGGIQFDKVLPNSNQYYLDYFLKFEEGFDFALGGKLPGLTSGGEKYTGGIHPDNGEGWSARYMWIEGGEIIIYFYHMDMEHKWGDTVKMNTVLEAGKWHRITQHIVLNDSDKFNGLMEVWLDGKKVINDTEVRYRLAPLGDIDSFYFSTFHGGNTPDWAPKVDSFIYFDDFKVSKSKPNNLE